MDLSNNISIWKMSYILNEKEMLYHNNRVQNFLEKFKNEIGGNMMKKDSRQRCKRRLNTRMNESSEAVEDTNIKRILKDANVSFLLFFIPVIATICTYYFCRGYYNFFNIPPMFIEADFNFILEYVTLLTPLCVATILVCAIFVPTIGRKRKGLNHSEFVILNIIN